MNGNYGDYRDVEQLRAQVETLQTHLANSHKTITSFIKERDMWKDRANSTTEMIAALRSDIVQLVSAIMMALGDEPDPETADYACPTCGYRESADEFLRRPDSPRCAGGCEFENSVMRIIPTLDHSQIDVLRDATFALDSSEDDEP